MCVCLCVYIYIYIGRQQATVLAQKIAETYKPDKVIRSDMTRAIETFNFVMKKVFFYFFYPLCSEWHSYGKCSRALTFENLLNLVMDKLQKRPTNSVEGTDFWKLVELGHGQVASRHPYCCTPRIERRTAVSAHPGTNYQKYLFFIFVDVVTKISYGKCSRALTFENLC